MLFHNMIDRKLYLEALAIDSTSGQERDMALWAAERLQTPHCSVELSEVGDGTLNVLLSWGEPKVLFCTHLDTVPPYIPPTMETLPDGDVMVKGRGVCDAKGQMAAMYAACLELERQGETDFGLLLLAGEETGSYGAKAFAKRHCTAHTVVVGEPTDGKQVSTSKGTNQFSLKFTGVSAHSGYPHLGVSAVEKFVDFVNALRGETFPDDALLGKTTWNIGRVSAPAPQNVLSPELTCRVYFRTTFATCEMVVAVMRRLQAEHGFEMVEHGGDKPTKFHLVPGIDQCTVAFGSDAPQLHNIPRKMLCGAGSILVAHSPDERVLMSQLEEMVQKYVMIYKELSK